MPSNDACQIRLSAILPTPSPLDRLEELFRRQAESRIHRQVPQPTEIFYYLPQDRDRFDAVMASHLSLKLMTECWDGRQRLFPFMAGMLKKRRRRPRGTVTHRSTSSVPFTYGMNINE